MLQCPQTGKQSPDPIPQGGEGHQDVETPAQGAAFLVEVKSEEIAGSQVRKGRSPFRIRRLTDGRAAPGQVAFDKYLLAGLRKRGALFCSDSD